MQSFGMYTMFMLNESKISDTVWRIVPQILLFLVCIKIYLCIQDFKKYVVPAAIILVIGIAVYLKGGMNILDLIILIVGLYGISLDYIATMYLCVSVPYMIYVTVASQIGTITDIVYYGANNYVRHSMGMAFPADYSGAFVCMLLAFIYLNRNKKFKWIEVTVCAALTWLVYKASGTRTDFAIATFAVALLLLDSIVNLAPKLAKTVHKTMELLAMFVLPVVILGTFLLPLTYSEESPMNNISGLSTIMIRLRIMKEAITNYKVTLLGQDLGLVGFGGSSWVDMLADTYNILDNSYISWFYKGGVLIFLVLIFILGYGSYKAWKKDYFWLSMIIVLFELQNVLIQGYGMIYKDLILLIPFATLTAYSPIWCTKHIPRAAYESGMIQAQNKKAGLPMYKSKPAASKVLAKHWGWIVVYVILSVAVSIPGIVNPQYGYADDDPPRSDVWPLQDGDIVFQGINVMATYSGIQLPIYVFDGPKEGYVEIEFGTKPSETEWNTEFIETLPVAEINQTGYQDLIFTKGHILKEGKYYYMRFTLKDAPNTTVVLYVGENNRTDYAKIAGRNTNFYEDTAIAFNMIYKANSHLTIAWIIITGIFVGAMYLLFSGLWRPIYPWTAKAKRKRAERRPFVAVINQPSLGMAYHFSLNLRLAVYLLLTTLFLFGTGWVGKSTFANGGMVMDYEDPRTEGFYIDENNSFFQCFDVERDGLTEIRIYLEKYTGAEMDPLIVAIDDVDYNMLYQNTFTDLDLVPGTAITLTAAELEAAGIEFKKGEQYLLGLFAAHQDGLDRPTLMQITYYYGPSVNMTYLWIALGTFVLVVLLCLLPIPTVKCVQMKSTVREVLWAVMAFIQTALVYLTSGAEKGYLSLHQKTPAVFAGTDMYSSSWKAKQEAILEVVLSDDGQGGLIVSRIFILLGIMIVILAIEHALWALYWPHLRVILATTMISLFAGWILYRNTPGYFGHYTPFMMLMGLLAAATLLILSSHLRVRDRSSQQAFHEKYVRRFVDPDMRSAKGGRRKSKSVRRTNAKRKGAKRTPNRRPR